MRIIILIALFLPFIGCAPKAAKTSEKLSEILIQNRWKYDGDSMQAVLALDNKDGKIEQRMKRNISQMEGGHFIFNPDGRLQILLPKINIRGDWSVDADGSHLNFKIDGSVNVKHPIMEYDEKMIKLNIDAKRTSFPRVFIPVQM